MWRKSSYSNSGMCIEVDTLGAPFRKPSWSTANGACIEVAHVPADMQSSSSYNGSCVQIGHEGGEVLIQDSKNPGPHLHIPAFYWPSILAAFRDDVFPVTGPLHVTRRHCHVSVGKENWPVNYLFQVDGDSTVLTYTPPEWDAFIAGVRNGEFDLMEVAA